MKKILLILACLMTYLVSGYAQTETKRDSISINLENNILDINGLNESTYQLEKEETTYITDVEELKKRAEFVKTLQFNMPEFYVGPPTENKTLGEKLPHTNDYAYYGYQDLGNDFYLGGGSTYRSYPTIGAMQMVSTSLYYQPYDWIGMSGGVYGAKYNAYGQHYNDAGFNASLRLKLTDRIYLRGHGNYSMGGQDRSRYLGPATMGMFPQTYYGGGVEFKINDSFGVEGGMVRNFNPMKRKWENIPYLMPVFYSNGRRR